MYIYSIFDNFYFKYKITKLNFLNCYIYILLKITGFMNKYQNKIILNE